MDCALSGEADGAPSLDSPQKFGGAQAKMWHSADGHPLIERYPEYDRTSVADCGSRYS